MRYFLTAAVLVVAGLCASTAQAQIGIGGVRVDVPGVRVAPNVSVNVGGRVGVGDNWRYVQRNGRWWYWMPGNYWMYWSGAGWQRYGQNSYQYYTTYPDNYYNYNYGPYNNYSWRYNYNPYRYRYYNYAPNYYSNPYRGRGRW